MNKNLAKQTFGETVSTAFLDQIEKNDRNCGTSASLTEGMEITLVGFDYFDGHRTVGADEYNEVPARQKHRYSDNGDGTYTVDNSYYGCNCTGAVTAVSFRTLTGAAQAPNIFEGCLMIPAGRASEVAKALLPYINKTLKVVKVEPWEADTEWNGRKQAFAGRAIGFKVVNTDTDNTDTDNTDTDDTKKGKK